MKTESHLTVASAGGNAVDLLHDASGLPKQRIKFAMAQGAVWLTRLREQWPSLLWINPVPERHWQYTQSIDMIQNIIGPQAMVPMTLEGIGRGMKLLGR